MILPEPFSGFDFHQFKIKIENIRDKTDIKKAVLYIVIPILVVLIIIAISIFFYCKKKYYDNSSNDNLNSPIYDQSSTVTYSKNPNNNEIQEPIKESQDYSNTNDLSEKSPVIND